MKVIIINKLIIYLSICKSIFLTQSIEMFCLLYIKVVFIVISLDSICSTGYMCLCVYQHVHAWTCMCMYVCMHVCVVIYVYVFMP